MNPLTRSELLVHWTGHDLVTSDSFIERLQSLYRHGLFYASPSVDVLRGVGPRDRELPRLPSICFTEMRLRHAHRFSEMYGRLGIVFYRTYLMKHGGANPVFYLQSDNNGIVNTIVTRLSQRVATSPGSRMIHRDFDLQFVLSFCKPMSDPGVASLAYFEEYEWRMVVNPKWKTDGSELPPEYVSCNDSPSSRAFRFRYDQVQAIVFPDHETRVKAIEDSILKSHFKSHIPQMIELDLCSHV